MKNYKWMEECIVVDGYMRSCIYDLPRQKTYFVDKNTASLIEKIENIDAEIIEKNLSQNELEWFLFFKEKEFLFKVPHSLTESFPKIQVDWKHPSKIISAIIESSIYLPKILKFLNELNCHHIILSFKNSSDIQKVLNKHFKRTFLKSLDIIVEKNNHNNNYYKTLKEDFPILVDIYIKESSKKIVFCDKSDFRRIIKVNSFTENKLAITVEIKLFMEAHFHNVYLNKKLYFNRKGDFFNTPETTKKLGNIKNVECSINLLEFSKVKEWDAKKDNTLVCEVCELRYACTNNRIPILREQDGKWYHETECEYNPYIGLWKGEKNYLPLNKCGIVYNKKELKINKTKLDSINTSLWG